MFYQRMAKEQVNGIIKIRVLSNKVERRVQNVDFREYLFPY